MSPGRIGREHKSWGELAAPQAHVSRMIEGDEVLNDRLHVGGKCGNESMHLVQTKQRAIITQRMMRASHYTVSVSAAVAEEFDRHVVHADVVAYLLVGSGVDEWRNAVNPRPEPGPRQSSRDRHHVLFRHTRVDEPRSRGCLERFKGLESKIACQENELGVVRIPDQRLTEDLSHERSIS